MHRSALHHDLHVYTHLRQKLLEAFPDADEDTIRDTLEGLTTLHELIAEIIRSALIDEALQSGLRLRLQDMKERLSRLETRSVKKRELALEAISEAGLRKIEQPDFTASARAGPPSLVVLAEDQIPEGYWAPQPPKLDRQALLGDLKQGDEIPGAELSNSKPVLSVRTK
jgi:Siphovirus Gp157